MSGVITKSTGGHESNSIFGFWIYLMSDCLLFASLFATYAVLHLNTAGGPSAKELFSLPFVLGETMILLTSSFTSGIALLYARRGGVKAAVLLLMITLCLGLGFLAMEVTEFRHLISEGHGPWASAFLSSFFTLVGTHGLHVSLGALWMMVLIAEILLLGVKAQTLDRLTCLTLFWHFLDIVWIFIFTFIYLFGAI